VFALLQESIQNTHEALKQLDADKEQWRRLYQEERARSLAFEGTVGALRQQLLEKDARIREVFQEARGEKQEEAAPSSEEYDFRTIPERILATLDRVGRPMPVAQIAGLVGKSPSRTSDYCLQLLKQGKVERERVGKMMVYRVKDKAG
jgi:hypothetical protein